MDAAVRPVPTRPRRPVKSCGSSTSAAPPGVGAPRRKSTTHRYSPVCKSTTETRVWSAQSWMLSSLVKSNSFRMIFGRAIISRRILENQTKRIESFANYFTIEVAIEDLISAQLFTTTQGRSNLTSSTKDPSLQGSSRDASIGEGARSIEVGRDQPRSDEPTRALIGCHLRGRTASGPAHAPRRTPRRHQRRSMW